MVYECVEGWVTLPAVAKALAGKPAVLKSYRRSALGSMRSAISLKPDARNLNTVLHRTSHIPYHVFTEH